MSTFLQQQQQLAELLGENGTGNGYWSQSIKQRFLNLGVFDVMIQTKSGPIVTDSTGSTSPSTRTYTLPTNFLAPRKLYIDGKPYRRIQEERELELLDGDLDNEANYTAAAFGPNPDRFYVLDLTANTYRVLPKPTSVLQIKWIYLKIPTTLSADADIANIPTILHELPAVWAGWQLSYRSKEHAARGAQLREEYRLGMAQKLIFLNMAIDDPEIEIGLDPKFFSDTSVVKPDFTIVGR